MSREENLRIWEDTKFSFEHNYELVGATEKACKYTQVIPEGKDLGFDLSTFPEKEGKLILERNSTFNAGRRLSSQRTAVLNFASATNPGGGVTKGATAQEECLCRCSNLYPVLDTERCWNEFYQPHRDNLNALHNDDIIWTPEIAVFKSDDYKAIDITYLDVITCAAPNLREKNVNVFNIDRTLETKIDNNQLHSIHYKRACRIFEVALKKGVENIVVGAFGCGAFKNDPETVAKAWYNAAKVYLSKFNTIDFAIYDSPRSNNYQIFRQFFDKNS